MDYRFTALIIILLCLLTLCAAPIQNPSLKTNSKDYIILPEPVISDNEKAWNDID